MGNLLDSLFPEGGWLAKAQRAYTGLGGTPDEVLGPRPEAREEVSASRRELLSPTQARFAALPEENWLAKIPRIYERPPYEGEVNYFRENSNVAGMATEDEKVIINPFRQFQAGERESVVQNEIARVLMRSGMITRPMFDITPEQKAKFATYGTEQDVKETIAARLLSGDPSAGNSTAEQLDFVNKLKILLAEFTESGLEMKNALIPGEQ